MGGVEPGVTKIYAKIPLDRIGVLIGKEGGIKRELMKRTRTKVTIDSVNGTVIIEPEAPDVNPINILKARDFVLAISYGFSPERAFRVLGEDQTLVVMDLKSYVGDKPNHLARIKARLIGEHGKARRIIEEMTDTYISISNTYVAIIGDYERANVAREAIEMLIRGQRHASVYRFLERAMREIRRKEALELWRTFKPYRK